MTAMLVNESSRRRRKPLGRYVVICAWFVRSAVPRRDLIRCPSFIVAQASRARAVPMHIRRPAIRPQPAPAAALSRSIEPSAATKPSAEAGDIDQDDTTADAAGRPDRAAKRRRISFASNAASGTVAGEISKDGVRTSSRKATVRNKRETQEKLREAEERKVSDIPL